MRIAIFSDIHSNIDALKEAIRSMEALSPDRYICLGDVVGYGATPNECCEVVRPLVAHCILGNHDAAVCGRMDYAYYYDAARTALSHHARLVDKENMNWLRELPYTVVEDGVCYSHGSPIAPENFDYILTEENARDLADHWDDLQPVTFIGHSHLTKAFRMYRDEEGQSWGDEVTGDEILIDPTFKYVITVGSAGQPRDNDARACFVLWDTEERTVTYHRVSYDIVKAAERIFEDKRLAPDFGKRLFLGI